MNGNGVCKGIQLELQGLKFNNDCISLELSGVDMVLGVQWLRTLGKCEFDWECQEWGFKHEGRWVLLSGDRNLHKPKSTMPTLFPTTNTEDTMLES